MAEKKEGDAIDLAAPVKRTTVQVSGKRAPTVAELRAALAALDPAALVAKMELQPGSIMQWPSWQVVAETVVEQAPKP